MIGTRASTEEPGRDSATAQAAIISLATSALLPFRDADPESADLGSESADRRNPLCVRAFHEYDRRWNMLRTGTEGGVSTAGRERIYGGNSTAKADSAVRFGIILPSSEP